jgi:hypothetical protein
VGYDRGELVKSLKFIKTIFKNSIPNVQNAHPVSITETSQLKLCSEIITVYFENHTKLRRVNFLNKVNIEAYVTYCYGFDQRVVRQRLRKHGPTRNNR